MKTKKFIFAFFILTLSLSNMLFGVIVLSPVARFNHSGQKIVSTNGKNAKLWYSPSGAYIATLSGHLNDINVVDFSHDDNMVATGSDDGTAKLWNGHTGVLIATTDGKHKRGISDLKFNPNGSYVVTVSLDKHIMIWDYEGNLIKDINHGAPIMKMAFNNMGTVLATADGTGMVRIWDFVEGENFGNLLTSFKHASTIMTWIEFNLDDDLIITAGKDATARVWAWNEMTHEVSLWKELVHGSPIPSRITCATINPESTILITTSKDSLVKLWYVNSGKNFRTLNEHTDISQSSRFNRTGNLFVTSSFDETAKEWNLTSSESVLTFAGEDGHTGAVYWAEFDYYGDYIVTASNDGSAKIWNAETGALEATLN